MLLLYPSIPPGIVEFFYHFTFHYASTISLSPADSPGWERAFTFHYASTISWLTYQNTMELLIFTFHYASTISYIFPPLPRLQSLLYIPLCFYYILWVDNGQPISDHFTFHYASTISCSSEGLMSLFSPLHSTMLLLYPAYNGKGAYTNNFTFHYASTISYQVYFPLVLRIWLYIPLCFYYIECSYCITADGKALYIPLCFYYILC